MPPETTNDIHLNIALEETVNAAFQQLSRYAELRSLLSKLVRLGMHETGLPARLQVQNAGPIRNLWSQVRQIVWLIKHTAGWRLRIGYAGGPGKVKVRKNLVSRLTFERCFRFTCIASIR